MPRRLLLISLLALSAAGAAYAAPALNSAGKCSAAGTGPVAKK